MPSSTPLYVQPQATYPNDALALILKDYLTAIDRLDTLTIHATLAEFENAYSATEIIFSASII